VYDRDPLKERDCVRRARRSVARAGEDRKRAHRPRRSEATLLLAIGPTESA